MDCPAGPSRTGKNTLLRSMIKFCSDENFNTFLLCPEAYRLSRVSCLIDTFDGGTMHKSNNVSSLPGKILNHRGISVDENVFLREEQIDHLFNAWKRCGRWSTIVTAGDEQQLRPWNDDLSPVVLYPSTQFWKTTKNIFLFTPSTADGKYLVLCMRSKLADTGVVGYSCTVVCLCRRHSVTCPRYARC